MMRKMKIRQYIEEILLFFAFISFGLISYLTGNITLRVSRVLILAACVLFAQLAQYVLNFILFAFSVALDRIHSSYITSDAVFRMQAPYKSGYIVEKRLTSRHSTILSFEEMLSFRIVVKTKKGSLVLVSPRYLELRPNTAYRFVYGSRSKIITDVHQTG